MRCLTLAVALRERGAECRVLHRHHPGHMADVVRNYGFAVHELPEPDSLDSINLGETDYAGWLGVNPQRDARETAEALEDWAADWLVVDHYALGADWEHTVRPCAGGIVVLDDLANRRHECDLLVNQNRIPDAEDHYASLVPEGARCLCGPRYALLRPEYSRARELIGPRRGPLSRVLVFYGGADTHNETGRALRVLSRPEFRHLAVDVVLGANHPARENVLKQAGQRPATEVHGPRDHLADLMIEADLALGGGGTTTWERCALGLPSIVTAIADNQMAFNQTLDKDGAVHFLGHWSRVSDNDLAQTLAHYAEHPDRLVAMGQSAWRITDGLGRLRTAEALMPSDRTHLTLRPAQRGDKFLYFEWANDPTTRANADNPESISWATHDSWFEDRLTDPDTVLWVMVTLSELPVGQVRVEIEAGEGVIDYSVDPAFRGRGWGTRVLELAVSAWRSAGGDHVLAGEVHAENMASCRAFLRAGFEEVEAKRGGRRRFRLPSSPAL